MPDEIGVIPGLYVQGDAGKVVAAINDALETRQIRKAGLRNAASRAVLDEAPYGFAVPDDGLDPRGVARNLAAALPKGVLVTCGVGHFLSWPVMYMALPEGAEIQFSYQFGAIGQTLPLAVGVGVGNRGRAHVVIEGDGSLLLNLQELETICRYQLPMVLVVWNDGGYGAEVHRLGIKGIDPAIARWVSPDFVAIARAFGGDGVLLSQVSDLGGAVKAGLAQGGLYLIDARVSPSTMSDPYVKLTQGLENRAPLLRPVL